jgi:Large ribosomal RNA subunit accumulation protein YceD
MNEHNRTPRAPIPSTPWQVPVAVEDVAGAGAQFDLVADADVRAAVARMAGLRELSRFEASFAVTRHGSDGLKVAGKVSATVGQTCVVTLEPIANEVAEDVDLIFMPRASDAPGATETSEPSAADDNTEPLLGGIVDLGAIATEFLVLGLDPYPRKPGAVFQPPPEAAADESPFVALAALKQSGNDP